MLPEKWAATATVMQRHAVDDQPARHEKACPGHAVHQLHHNRGFERRKGKEQEERRHELRPDEERQPHPSHPFGAELDDGRDEIDRAQKRRGNEQNKTNEPERLAVENRIVGRALVGDDRERRVGGPSAFRGAARNEEADQHDEATEEKRLVARHVDFRKGHIRRADLERHDEIPEGGERDRHDAEEDHDRAVHRA